MLRPTRKTIEIQTTAILQNYLMTRQPFLPDTLLIIPRHALHITIIVQSNRIVFSGASPFCNTLPRGLPELTKFTRNY